MSSLYNISQEYLNLLSEIEDLGGEITPEIEEKLSINRNEVEDKVRAYYFIKKQTEGEIEVISDEIDRLKSKIEEKGRLIDRLKKYVGNALILYGDRGKSGNFKLTVGDLTIFNVYHKPVIIEDGFSETDYIKYSLNVGFSVDQMRAIEETLGFNFGDDVIAPKVNKRLIKEELSNGVEIPKARIDKEAYYIRFK